LNKSTFACSFSGRVNLAAGVDFEGVGYDRQVLIIRTSGRQCAGHSASRAKVIAVNPYSIQLSSSGTV
jgi:hypothetical protein